jgi:putative peptidoglycan lipid II flippase
LSFFKSGLLIAFFTLISRVFGLVRELVIANFFGTNLFADSINTAFKFPNLFRRIFGEGALSSVFIPIYSEKITTSKAGAERFASEVYTLLFISLSALTILIIILMPYIMLAIAPGFISSPEKFQISVLLSRITMPYMLFISMAALIGAIQNSNNKYAAFAFMPVILNIFVILSCFLGGSEKAKAIYISMGILVGGVGQYFFMKLTSKIYGIKFSFISIKCLTKDAYKFLKNLFPAAVGNSFTQINLFISNAIASFAPGAISILSYTDRIYQLPLSIIGLCFGTILLPNLSKLYGQNKIEEATSLQTNALKISIFLSAACAAGLASLAQPIIHTIYERGLFLHSDTIKVSDCLFIFSFGLPAFILNKVLTPIFYANHDAKTPFKITSITIVINIILNIILIKDYKHLGIAIASVFSSWLNVMFIFYFLKKDKLQISNQGLSLFIFKTISAGAVLFFASKYFFAIFSYKIYSSGSLYKFIYLLLVIIISSVVFFALAAILRVFSLKEIRSFIRFR